MFCVIHHVVIAKFFLSLSDIERDSCRKQFGSGRTLSRTGWQAVKLVRPYDLLLLEQVRGLHKAYRGKTVWAIDTEFASLHEAYPVPFIISIRDLRTSKVVL